MKSITQLPITWAGADVHRRLKTIADLLGYDESGTLILIINTVFRQFEGHRIEVDKANKTIVSTTSKNWAAE